VFDGGFEGVPEYKVAFRKETDRIERPWYPDGAVNRGEFLLDRANPFNGKVSQCIRQKPGDPSVLGISQGEKYVKVGEALRCSLQLRASDPRSVVTVSLWGNNQIYATADIKPTEHWQRFEATLTPTGTDTHATFTISFRGPGAIWIDQVSLMPVTTVFGWRTDVAEAMKELKPRIIRFGGSTIEGFEWTATIGAPEKRVPFTTVWGGLEPANAGLDEFLKLCKWVDAEPLICVRFSAKKPKDAADQVEYVNGPATSTMGKLRAVNGHPEPYGVKYWQIGNELGDAAYQQGVAQFCRAMKAVDPSIKLLGAFPSPGLLQNAGGYLDYVCPHHYGCQNLKGVEEDVLNLTKMIAVNAPGRTIRLGITEWNTTGGDWGLDRAMLWNLDNALWCSRYHNFMHRHCDMIEIANRSNLTDSFCSGIIQTNNSSLFKTPTYYAEQLYATHAGQYPLKVGVDGGADDDEALDISATLSEDEKRVVIFAVNPLLESRKRSIDFSTFGPLIDQCNVWTVADTAKANQRDAANSWREPQSIRTEAATTTLVGSTIPYDFPALSLTVIEVRRK
jgi:alpha-N-arabinofuranosidase